MEVYIDDMLIKSKERQDHANHFQQAFDLLRTYGMKLNPAKWDRVFRTIPRLHDDTKGDRGQPFLASSHSRVSNLEL